MIKNGQQLATTTKELALLEGGLAWPAPDVHPLLAEASRRALGAQAEDLRAEIEDYRMFSMRRADRGRE